MISSVIYYSTDARKNEIYLLKTQADDEILPYLYFYITQPKTFTDWLQVVNFTRLLQLVDTINTTSVVFCSYNKFNLYFMKLSRWKKMR